VKRTEYPLQATLVKFRFQGGRRYRAAPVFIEGSKAVLKCRLL
jgi:hypothetical protein